MKELKNRPAMTRGKTTEKNLIYTVVKQRV